MIIRALECLGILVAVGVLALVACNLAATVVAIVESGSEEDDQ